MVIKSGDTGENVRLKISQSHRFSPLKTIEGKMTTERQIEANRKNALLSTGPKH